jgi:hypothetical protein
VRAVLLLILTGCWSATPARPIQPAPVETPEPRAPDVPGHSVWVGRYACTQGETAVTLRIDTMPDGSATATFEFGPHEGNPNIPHGTFRLTGSLFANARGVLELRLAPDKWLEQPPNYVMVGVFASSDPGQRTLTGKIDNPACDWIRVDRQK